MFGSSINIPEKYVSFRFIDESFRCCSFPLHNCYTNTSGERLSIVGMVTMIFNSFEKCIRGKRASMKSQVYNNYISKEENNRWNFEWNFQRGWHYTNNVVQALWSVFESGRCMDEIIIITIVGQV